MSNKDQLKRNPLPLGVGNTDLGTSYRTGHASHVQSHTIEDRDLHKNGVYSHGVGRGSVPVGPETVSQTYGERRSLGPGSTSPVGSGS